MKEAPKSSRPSPLEVEKQRYSLTQLLNLLQLADRFMDTKVFMLHKLGCHEPALLYFLHEMNLYLKFHPSQFDVIVTSTQEVLQTITNSEGLRCEINHVWARLVKLMFMNTNVLDLNDMRVNCCRTIYVDGLKKLLAESVTESINPDTKKPQCHFENLQGFSAQSTLYEFMGQLLDLGFEPTVKAIHNFLYLAKKVASTPESGMSIEHIAVTIAPTMHEMLHLHNVLCPTREKTATFAMKKSVLFMTSVIEHVLKTNRINSPFDPVIYKDYRQAKYEHLYQKVMPVLTDPTRLLGLDALLADDATLESQFKKLHIKQPIAVQAGFTCDALAASLAKKEEEPIVRPTVARILTKSAGSRMLSQQISAEDLDAYHRSLSPPATLIFSEPANCPSAQEADMTGPLTGPSTEEDSSRDRSKSLGQ